VGELDLRLILTLAGMGVSVVSAAVIVKTKLAAVVDTMSDIESRLRSLNSTVDRQQAHMEVANQKLGVLSGMLAPDKMEARARELATMQGEISGLHGSVSKLLSMHSGRHPPIDQRRQTGD
jgi:chromosome segregation ATPase